MKNLKSILSPILLAAALIASFFIAKKFLLPNENEKQEVLKDK